MLGNNSEELKPRTTTDKSMDNLSTTNTLQSNTNATKRNTHPVPPTKSPRSLSPIVSNRDPRRKPIYHNNKMPTRDESPITRKVDVGDGDGPTDYKLTIMNTSSLDGVMILAMKTILNMIINVNFIYFFLAKDFRMTKGNSIFVALIWKFTTTTFTIS
jgi:hypothetical protein